MTTVLTDLRHGLRLLLKTPGFTAAAALSLGLGIGVNTMTFSGINSVLLKPIPVDDVGRVAAVFTLDERNGGQNQLSRPNLLDYQQQNDSFDGITGYQFTAVAFSPTGGEPEMGQAQLVTGNFFEVLGVRAALGRVFGSAEDRVPGQNLVAVLSDDGWRRHFAADPSVIGRTVMFNRHAFTVIGVAPRGFRGVNAFARPIAWLPSMCYREVTTGFELENWDSRRALLWSAAGRLKAGVGVEQARANLATIAKRLERDYPTDNKGRSASVVPLAEARFPAQARRNVALASGMLMTIVGLVLLVACANVANLLLARATSRRREFAMRLALGATRTRIVRQLLAEGVALALLGGALAVPLAFAGQTLLLALRPPFVPDDFLDVVPDARVLAFTAVISLVSGIVFGLAPALRASNPDLVTELKEGTADSAGGSRVLALRNLLVAAQLAVSLVALATAGLFVRSLDATLSIDPGFDAERLGTFTVDLGSNGYDEAGAREFQRRMVERVSGIAGVESAALANWAPLVGGGFSRTVFLEGQDTSDPSNGRLVQVQVVDDAYHRTMGIRLLRGRAFLRSDLPATPLVVIVNEAMARRSWPGQDPVGRRFRFFGNQAPIEVVGLAANSAFDTVDGDREPLVYQPLSQISSAYITLMVRARQPSAAIGSARREVQQLDRQLPILFVTTMSDAIRQSLFLRRFGAGLLMAFGVLALVLSLVGVYGVMAYTVGRRTREMGIRMALGASHADLVRGVVVQGGRLTMVGVAVGLGLALALGRVIGGLLYGVGAADPLTFIAVPAVLAAGALGASYLPARRAARIDPLAALRHE